MAKQEFFRVPVLGPAMLYRGFIPVDRKNRERAIAAVEQAVAVHESGKLVSGVSRKARAAPTAACRLSRKGLFVMAIKAGALIVPVSVSGARKIMPKGKFAIHPGLVRITIHDPISAADYTVEKRRELIQVTRQAILKGLEPDEWPREKP